MTDITIIGASPATGPRFAKLNDRRDAINARSPDALRISSKSISPDREESASGTDKPVPAAPPAKAAVPPTQPAAEDLARKAHVAELVAQAKAELAAEERQARSAAIWSRARASNAALASGDPRPAINKPKDPKAARAEAIWTKARAANQAAGVRPAVISAQISTRRPKAASVWDRARQANSNRGLVA
ncbi:hypothetical protein [Sphingobium phenoxybenzoativorans]|uniref:hypothetical protein n=1 Tax=Sphingobium phenoxybenzoativorans TaxID=1592790 RepID=UPI000873101F|nr:hypothetical protein [Sphingobium phenoxybenzoativorans]